MMKLLYLPENNLNDSIVRKLEKEVGSPISFSFTNGKRSDYFSKETLGFKGIFQVEYPEKNKNYHKLALRIAKAFSLAIQNYQPLFLEIPITIRIDSNLAESFQISINKSEIQILTHANYISKCSDRFELRLDIFNFIKNINLPETYFLGKPIDYPSSNAYILLIKNIYDKLNTPYRYCNSTQYLVGALKKHQHRVLVPPFLLETDDFTQFEAILKQCGNEIPNIIGITLMQNAEKKVIQFVDQLRRLMPETIFIAGGGAVNNIPEQIIANFMEVDIFVRGEGEKILPEICNRIGFKKRSDLKDIDFSGLDGVAVNNKCQLRINNINHLNRYRKDEILFDLESLTEKDFENGLCIYMSRGCKNACSFCLTPIHKEIVVYSDDVLDEFFGKYLKKLENIYGNRIPQDSKNIYFVDDEFLGDIDFAIRAAKILNKYGLKLFAFQTSVRSILNARYRLEELFSYDDSQFADAIDYLYIGVENTANQELKYLGKGYTFSKIKEAISLIHDYRIKSIEIYRIDYNYYTDLKSYKEHLANIDTLKNMFPKLSTAGDGNRLRTEINAALFYKRIKKSGMKGFVIDREKAIIDKDFPEFNIWTFEKDLPSDLKLRKQID